jgi:hypothetical protein
MDEDQLVRPDRARPAIEIGLTAPVNKREHLIRIGMDFFANLAADRDRHHHDLLVFAGSGGRLGTGIARRTGRVARARMSSLPVGRPCRHVARP